MDTIPELKYAAPHRAAGKEDGAPLPRIPHDLEIEKALLSSMMLSAAATKGVFGAGITEHDFFDVRNIELFGVCRKLADEGKPLAYPLIASRCVTDEAVLWATDTFVVCSTGANWKYYAEVLRENTMARKVINSSRAMLEAASTPARFTELPKVIAEEMENIGPLFQPVADETFDSQLNSLLDSLERQEPRETFPFGLKELDEQLAGGVHRGEMFVIGGPTGAGKSVLLLMAALEAALAGKSVVIFSLEMNTNDLLIRLCSNFAGMRIKGAAESPTKREMDAASRAIMTLRGKHIALKTKICDIRALEQTVMQLAGEGKADVVIADYIQLIETNDGETREQAVSSVSRRLKNLAMSANVAMFTASQLNDEGRLRESRAIGQNADGVAIIEDKGVILLDKNRRGPRDVVIKVSLRGDISRFELREV